MHGQNSGVLVQQAAPAISSSSSSSQANLSIQFKQISSKKSIMEAAACFQPCTPLPATYIPLNAVRAPPTSLSMAIRGGFIKVGGRALFRQSRLGTKRRRWSSSIQASSSSPDSSQPIAPLHMESPAGQFLSQILTTHPHLLPAAVEQQLEKLQTDRDAEQQEDKPSSSGMDLVLYRRIAEVRANERSKALEEILYALIVERFINGGVSLIPSISRPSDRSQRVDSWPEQEEESTRFHSHEAYEMIQNHLALILGHRVGDSDTIAEISKLRVGQVYAASVMYGYFLRRVDQRFQLEKSTKILPSGLNEEDSTSQPNTFEEARSKEDGFHGDVSDGFLNPGGFGYGVKATRLRSYVMSFDSSTLQRYATVRSKEAVRIIEKQTEALFGKPEIIFSPQGGIDSSTDEVLKMGFSALKRIVLEAVTFGSFLWDVESYVDSRYHFV